MTSEWPEDRESADVQIIGGSVRPDGTQRKEIRKRADFKSEEDAGAQVFQTRQVAELREAQQAARRVASQPSKKSEKRRRNRENKRKKAAATAKNGEPNGVSDENASQHSVETSQSTESSADSTKQKTLRKLNKKLRVIEDLEERARVEGMNALHSEQREKIRSKLNVQIEIMTLESDFPKVFRKMQKKLRQVESLRERQAAGEILSKEELAKLVGQDDLSAQVKAMQKFQISE
eukprot:34041_1